MTDLAQAIADPNQPAAAYAGLEALVNETIGIKLFTLMELDFDRGVATRTYSNMPDAYPSSGEKPMLSGRWSEIVKGRQETFVANTIEEIAEVFSDHELIQSLGCESCLNLPIVAEGRLLGTLNCLNVAGHFTPERVAAADMLKLPGAAVFLLAKSLKKEG